MAAHGDQLPPVHGLVVEEVVQHVLWQLAKGAGCGEQGKFDGRGKKSIVLGGDKIDQPLGDGKQAVKDFRVGAFKIIGREFLGRNPFEAFLPNEFHGPQVQKRVANGRETGDDGGLQQFVALLAEQLRQALVGPKVVLGVVEQVLFQCAK